MSKDLQARQRFTEKEVSAILRRAAELQAVRADRTVPGDAQAGVLLTQLQQAAAELGIEPAMVEAALGTILKSLPESDYHLVPGSVVPAVCKLLGDSRDHTKLAALELLRLLGGGNAIWAVERLAQKASSHHVRDEAQRTLEVLRARQQRELAEQRLLRPASATDEATARLVRPVTGIPGGEEARLLRPSDQEEPADPGAAADRSGS